MDSPASLDETLVNRAAPPGSLRYFSLLYTPPEKRDAVTALYCIDAEIRESAQSANHDVAHTRLQWWRQEVDRLVNGNAQHPATRLLAALSIPRQTLSRLHELVVAADMDLARLTYVNMNELRAYAARSGGTVQELIAAVLLHPDALEEPERAASNRIGAGIRATEMLRDARQDACDGRLYFPLDELQKDGVKLEHVRAREMNASVKAVLARFCKNVAEDLDAAAASIPHDKRSHFRPLLVLAALHRRLLQRIAAGGYEIATERIELGPVEKPWVAWRAARKAR